MTVNYLIYDTKGAAQSAAVNMDVKYVPMVEETDVRGKPATHPKVTKAWSVPVQRKDGKWILHEYPGYTPAPSPVAIEPYDPEWFALETMSFMANV